MKVRITTSALFISSLVAAVPAFANPDAEPEYYFQVGSDVWSAGTSFSDNKEDSKRDSVDTQVGLSIAFEHQIPYAPNARIRYTPVRGEVTSFDKYDYTFYYDVIEHDLMHLDLGVTWSKYSDGAYTNPSDLPASSFDKFLFSWHANATITVPDTNFDVIGEFDFGNSDGDKTADLTAGMQYRMQFEKVDLAIRGGYRAMEYKFNFYPQAGDMSLTHGWFLGFSAGF